MLQQHRGVLVPAEAAMLFATELCWLLTILLYSNYTTEGYTAAFDGIDLSALCSVLLLVSSCTVAC
jgi:hypothetical protein